MYTDEQYNHLLASSQTPLVELKVKLSKRKLEELGNQFNEEGVEDGEAFLNGVRRECDVVIECYLNRKQEQCGKITGTKEAVSRAQEMLQEEFDLHRSKVVLKLDISYTDHGHIIGRGGRQIQGVMDSTGCHIHFPDGNRNSYLEKSNQVSIAGSPLNAEKAREEVRKLLPLTVAFDIANGNLNSTYLDQTHPIIQHVKKYYGVLINFKYATQFLSSETLVTVSVQGTRANYQSLKAAVNTLWHHFTNTSPEAGFFRIAIDIGEQNHYFVQGKHRSNIDLIAKNTGAVIEFPDSPFHKAPVRKTLVVVNGKGPDKVFMGWQYLLGYLPLTLIFDFPDDEIVDPGYVQHLAEYYEACISFRQKPKFVGKSAIVRAAEKDWRKLFLIRKHLLELDDSEVPNQFTPITFPTPVLPYVPATHVENEETKSFMKFVSEMLQKGLIDPHYSPSPVMFGFMQKQIAALREHGTKRQLANEASAHNSVSSKRHSRKNSSRET